MKASYTTEDHHCFTQFLVNATMRHDNFLPYPSEFIMLGYVIDEVSYWR
jgi:hypothetical protein